MSVMTSQVFILQWSDSYLPIYVLSKIGRGKNHLLRKHHKSSYFLQHHLLEVYGVAEASMCFLALLYTSFVCFSMIISHSKDEYDF